jgi:hypothetical protein
MMLIHFYYQAFIVDEVLNHSMSVEAFRPKRW